MYTPEKFPFPGVPVLRPGIPAGARVLSSEPKGLVRGGRSKRTPLGHVVLYKLPVTSSLAWRSSHNNASEEELCLTGVCTTDLALPCYESALSAWQDQRLIPCLVWFFFLSPVLGEESTRREILGAEGQSGNC